mmetsp:Transcript_10504/g.27824  ORF Transcript_10504/g.27824 Transcript_10504/m.27824 type:complete len:272 (-) Transcript_10504:400-1215(-)
MQRGAAFAAAGACRLRLLDGGREARVLLAVELLLDEQRHHGLLADLGGPVVAVRRGVHGSVLEGGQDVVPLHGDGVLQVARDSRGLSRMPTQHDVQETVEVRAALVRERVPVLPLVFRLRAVLLHLPVGAPRRAVVVEEDAVEHAERRQRLLPGALHHHYVRPGLRPVAQPLEDGLGALDDRVGARLGALDAAGAVPTPESDFQHVGGRVDPQRLHAPDHPRLLPLHHHLRTVGVEQLLLAVLVERVEEPVRPHLELAALPLPARLDASDL